MAATDSKPVGRQAAMSQHGDGSVPSVQAQIQPPIHLEIPLSQSFSPFIDLQTKCLQWVQLCTCHVLQGFFGNTAIVICQATSKCQVIKSALIEFPVTKSHGQNSNVCQALSSSVKLCQNSDVMSRWESKTTHYDYAKHRSLQSLCERVWCEYVQIQKA